MKPRVLYISRSIPHYRRKVLEKLREFTELRVLSGGMSLGLGTELEMPIIQTTKLYTLRLPGRARLYWQDIQAECFRFRPDVVVSEFGLSLLHLHWLLSTKRKLRFRLAFWTHGMGFNYRPPARSAGDRMRIRMLAEADGLFLYTEGCRASLRVELGEKTPSWIVWNTSDSDKINQCWRETAAAESPVKAPYVLYLGRLIHSKRVGELLPLAERASSRLPSLKWVIVGDGPLREKLEMEARRRMLSFEFLGAITDEEVKARLLRNAVAMVCPGGMGLNVVDSLGYGCPPVSYMCQPEGSRHGPEVEYLGANPGNCGWLVRDEAEFLATIFRLLDVQYRAEVGRRARQTFNKNCLWENQIAGFREGIASLTGKGLAAEVS